jgi:hypothetical protein
MLQKSPTDSAINESYQSNNLVDSSRAQNDNETDVDGTNTPSASPIAVPSSTDNENNQLHIDALSTSLHRDNEIAVIDRQTCVSGLTMTLNESENNHHTDDILPTYKEQVMEITRETIDQLCHSSDIVESRTMNNVVSIGCDNENCVFQQTVDICHNGEQCTIPVAEAYVITDDSICMNDIHVIQIDAGTVHVQTMSTCNSSQQQTFGETASTNPSSQTTSESDEECASYDKLRQIAVAAIRFERKFWIRLVIIALILNSILVAGIVVAIFCSKGACSSSSFYPTPITQIPSSSPTLAPSRSLTSIDSGAPVSVSWFGSSNSPSLARDNLSLTSSPIGLPEPTADMPTSESGKNSGVDSNLSPWEIALIASMAVVAELLIVLALISYNRRWKRARILKGPPESKT